MPVFEVARNSEERGSFSPLSTNSRRKHRGDHGCAERLPKRSQITMECRQTGVPVRSIRWHTERSNDPCTVQRSACARARLRKGTTLRRNRAGHRWTTSNFISILGIHTAAHADFPTSNKKYLSLLLAVSGEPSVRLLFPKNLNTVFFRLCSA